MSDLALLLLGVLAVYRVATDIALMDGPWALFARFRMWVGEHAAGQHWLAHGINCPICVAWWAAVPVALALQGVSWSALLWWLALAGGAAAIVRGTR